MFKLSIINHWYRSSLSLPMMCLLPLSWLYGLVVSCRRWCYRKGLSTITTFPIPVIVVGNITVGGTGKTPFVVWLANYLSELGYTPAIVTRGYGGKSHSSPCWVKPNTSTREVGDEAVLLAKNTNCPVVTFPDRVAAVKKILKNSQCNVIISDDGLQHYSLGASIKIAMVDGARHFGNGRLLPAGPLREPISYLNEMDIVIEQGMTYLSDYFFTLDPCGVVSMSDQVEQSFTTFPRQKVHAVAGIGHPERFFTMLQLAGFEVIAHPYPDHYHFKAEDLRFSDQYPIFMTEKDAVKCATFAGKNAYYVRVAARVSDKVVEALNTKLRLRHETPSSVTSSNM